MAEDQIVYVAVIPQDSLDDELAKAVAEVVGKAPYETRLLLVGVIPRIVARCRGASEADSAAKRLRGLGLTAIVSSEAELRGPSRGFRAQTIDFGEGEVAFHRGDGGERKLRAGDVFLIIRGIMQTYMEEETVKTGVKLNKGATVMLGGIPVFRKTKDKSKSPPLQTEWFLRLYGRQSSDPAVELRQLDIDYSFMGAGTSPSSLTNFTAVIDNVKKMFPQAIFDERLMKSFGTDIPATTFEDDLEINCRLIYFQHLPRGG
ncbi:MAG: hypothetical protein U9N44_02725 [Chloroflexota bacterium]|nr:hypothetical protein [Chloroflexota bacterium]